ncbi:hypothetical protein BB559_004924 [Furculomyces boomerangus]|uniref:Peptidase S54 rhomboid domain-containing protein n=1 Tax=Furculomyces boomerangus TaxID=61424 RepID=A0A2T9YBU1_9FUNG|nr:hypothetical protein BB559_004924 [Furculomyces boomerangus]
MSSIFRKLFHESQPTAHAAVVILSGLSLITAIIYSKLPIDTDNSIALSCSRLILLPALIIKYPWTIVTTSWIETDALSFLLGVIVLIPCVSILEKNWGVQDTVTFLAVSSILPTIATALVYIILGSIYDDARYSQAVVVNGLASIIAGFTIAFKQITPEYQVRLFGGAIFFKINNLPLVFMTIVPPLLFLFGRNSSILLLHFGIIISWVYLRFYKKNGDFRGDLSETFSFASFFPEFIQPTARMVSHNVYQLALKLHIVPQPVEYLNISDLELGGSFETYATELNDLETTVEAERRRNLAAKEVDSKLAQTSSQNGPQ